VSKFGRLTVKCTVSMLTINVPVVYTVYGAGRMDLDGGVIHNEGR
jgi:hypothetical protein